MGIIWPQRLLRISTTSSSRTNNGGCACTTNAVPRLLRLQLQKNGPDNNKNNARAIRRLRRFSSLRSIDKEKSGKEHSEDTTNSNATKLHILGSGSIGLFLAASLRAALPSYPVQLLLRQMLLRDHHLPKLKVCPNSSGTGTGTDTGGQSSCITVSLKRKLHPQGPPIPVMIPVPVQLISTTNKGTPPIQTLLVTTKAFQAVPALQSIRHLIDHQTQIIVLCNGGLAVQEEIQSVCGSLGIATDRKRVVQLASITHGVHKEESTATATTSRTTDSVDTLYRITQEGVGHVYLSDPKIADILDQANLNCRVLDQANLETHIWYKLAANCVCNPLTTLHQCTNGELSQKVKAFPSKMHDVLQEICLAHRIVTDVKQQQQQQQPNQQKQPLEYGPLYNFVEKVIEDNASNTTSMLQDVLHKRPTEIDYLNGYVVRVGDKQGLDFVMNRQLCLQIQKLEQQYYDS